MLDNFDDFLVEDEYCEICGELINDCDCVLSSESDENDDMEDDLDFLRKNNPDEFEDDLEDVTDGIDYNYHDRDDE